MRPFDLLCYQAGLVREFRGGNWRKRRKYLKEACENCGSGGKLVIDHRIPLNGGGLDRLDNYQTLCTSCNTIKGKRESAKILDSLVDNGFKGEVVSEINNISGKHKFVILMDHNGKLGVNKVAKLGGTTQRCSFELYREHIEQIDRVSAEFGLSKSEIVRTAIENYLSTKLLEEKFGGKDRQ